MRLQSQSSRAKRSEDPGPTAPARGHGSRLCASLRPGRPPWKAKSSRRLVLARLRGKAPAVAGEPGQQRRRLERLVVRAGRIGGEAVAQIGKPDLVGIEHRPAAPDRPAIAVDPDHVDVARPVGDALLEDARALVDHREDQALEDLLFVDRAALDAEPVRGVDDDLLDLRIGDPRAGPALLTEIDRAGPLAEAAHLSEP